MADANSSKGGQPLEDVTDATGRQMVDDIFEESRLRRVAMERDVEPDELADMALPADPFVGFHQRVVESDRQGETLVVASASQRRRYLLKRFDKGRSFQAWQSTPVAGEKLRLLNVYRVMLGQQVAAEK